MRSTGAVARTARRAALVASVLFGVSHVGGLASVSCLLPPVSSLLAQEAPLPDEATFFAEARENLARATRLQNRYAYKERRTELHMNPFGRLGSGAVVLYDVTPVADGSATIRRLIERDGARVSDSEPERRERRPRPRGRSVVEDAVSVLQFEIAGREIVAGRPAILVRFEPRPDSAPETREGRIAKVMRGTIWVDEATREVMRAEATAIDDLSFGFGIIARLNEGTEVTFTRAPVDGDVWMPTSISVSGQGRAILFRKLTIDHFIEWFDYREVAAPESSA